MHGIWFNRGVAGSQAFVKRFGQFTPPVGASEDHPAFAWLSRGLGEAFVRFAGARRRARVGAARRVLRVHLGTGLAALAAARDRRRGRAAGRARPGPRRGRQGPTTPTARRATAPRSPTAGLDDARHLADGAEQERAAAQQVPGADQGRAAGRGVDRLDQPHPGRGLRAPQRRPPGRATRRWRSRFLDYWAQLADQTDARPPKLRLWTRVDQPGRPRRARGIGHGPLAAGDDQPAAGLVRRRVRRRRPRARTSPARSG